VKAVVCTRYGPPEVLELREVDAPSPRKGEVCIRIAATAVTSSDCIVRSGNVNRLLWLPMRVAVGFRAPRRPLGMVLAGDVASVGDGVTSFSPGDQVFGFDRFGFGTYAELKCMSERGLLAPKPANLNYDEAAAIPYGGLLALYYLKRGAIQPGQNVLVYGASGAVGTSAVQLARHFGASVTGVCSTANLEFVASLGADTVIDYTKEDFLTKGDRYDLIFDAVPAAHRTMSLGGKGGLTPGGRYVSVTDGSPKFQVEDLTFLKELAEAGGIRPVIDRTYPLDQIVEAHRYVDTGRKKGNVVISVREQQPSGS
jgi:NADPH:quinone reductase-like Zn-dependent oxidoreductase